MIGWISGIAIVAVLSLLLALPALWHRAFAKDRPEPTPKPPEIGRDPAPVTPAKPLGRADVERELQKLARTPPPPTKVHGAMCYKPMAAPTDQVRWVCPTDGTVTTFPADDGVMARAAVEIQRRLPELRARGLDVSLDATALCPKCRRKRTPPPTALVLVVRYPGEPRERRFEGILPGHITLLVELLSGETVHKLAGPDTEPLRKSLPELRALLGLDQHTSSRAELGKLLADLPATPPKSLEMGAMCYDMAAPPQTNDYICPVDGHRTHYTKGEQSGLLSRELRQMRDAIKRIKKLDVTLDESELCRQCKPKVTEPAVVLVVRHADGTAQRTRHPSVEDVQMLAELLSGEAVHTGPTGTQTLLKQHEKRLRELLGL